MTTKHLPHYAGDADRIVFDGDGSVWVREQPSDIFKRDYCDKCAKRCDDDERAKRMSLGQVRADGDTWRCTAYVCAALDEWSRV